MDMHEILKMALKELEATASPEDVANYIKACVDKQAAIEGAAAAEEKQAEKDAKKDEAEMAGDVPPPDMPMDEPPPPAMSQQVPSPASPSSPAAPQGATSPDAALADAPPAAVDAGLAQLQALLSEKGSSLVALIDALKSGALDSVLAGAVAGTEVNEGTAEGLPGAPEYAALRADVKKLRAEIAAKDDAIASFKQAAAQSAAKAEKTEAEKKAETEAAAAKALADKRSAFATQIDGLIKTARLIPARGRSTEDTIATWTEIGMTMPDRFAAMVADLPPGVPTEVIAARSTGPEMRLSAPGHDGDVSHGPAYHNALAQYRGAGFGEKQAQAMAAETEKRLSNGASATSKLTGAA